MTQYTGDFSLGFWLAIVSLALITGLSLPIARRSLPRSLYRATFWFAVACGTTAGLLVIISMFYDFDAYVLFLTVLLYLVLTTTGRYLQKYLDSRHDVE